MLEGLLYVILGAGIEDLIWIKGRIYNISEIMFKLVKHVEIMINLPTPSWNDIQYKFIKYINYDLVGIFHFEQNKILF